MPTEDTKPPVREIIASDHTAILEIARRVNQSRRIVVLAGAGISTEGGMPDFRSKDGLYKRGAFDTQTLRGPAIFDSAFIRPDNAPTFYQNLLHIRRRARTSQPSSVHRLLKSWEDEGRLVRLYTQNIDDLERQAGLSVVPLGEEGRDTCGGGQGQEGAVPGQAVVQLHGAFRKLRFRCTLCHKTTEMPDGYEDELDKLLAANDVPRCDQCRVRGGGLPSRRATIGILRPDVLLFNEDHPHEQEIARIIRADAMVSPDLLLIVGTRMDIKGIQWAVKDFSRVMRARLSGSRGEVQGAGPFVLFVNREKIPLTSWKGVIDTAMWIDGEVFVQSLTLTRMPHVSSHMDEGPREYLPGGRTCQSPSRDAGEGGTEASRASPPLGTFGPESRHHGTDVSTYRGPEAATVYDGGADHDDDDDDDDDNDDETVDLGFSSAGTSTVLRDEGTVAYDDIDETMDGWDTLGWEITRQMVEEAEGWARLAEAYEMFKEAGVGF